MRVWMSGAGGLVGSALAPVLLSRGHHLDRWDRNRGDIGDAAAVNASVAEFNPDWVVHLAAFTAVDRCEAEPEEARRVNVEGTRVVAGAAEQAGAACLTLSSDYVFDGASDRPYTEQDAANPLSVYGRTKLESEGAVLDTCSRALVVRTAWLFGPKGPNFVGTVLRLAESEENLSVVNDQRGSPTYVPYLAEGLAALLEGGATGLYHLAGGGDGTWYDVARAAFVARGLPPERVHPVATEAFPRPAPRPRYSVLDCSRAKAERGVHLPPWRQGIEDYLAS